MQTTASHYIIYLMPGNQKIFKKCPVVITRLEVCSVPFGWFIYFKNLKKKTTVKKKKQQKQNVLMCHCVA